MCVTQLARDRQHQMDDLLLQEVDAELAAMPIEPVDDANSIRSVEVSPEWMPLGSS